MKCIFFLGTGMALSLNVFAAKLTCYIDPSTDAHTCYAPNEVRLSDNIRTASMYKGGPKNVQKTSFSFAVNCSTKVMHLKDRDGVSFAGAGPGQGTKLSRTIRDWICEEPLPPPKKK